MKFVAVIPARFASTRLPGKPLLEINGKAMVIHVAERARASGATAVFVATDHPEIAKTVEKHGFTAIMTRTDHASGTDRIAEVAAQQNLPGDTIVVNIQGDEPLIDPALIHTVAQQLGNHSDAAISTLCSPLTDVTHLANTNVVKVVLDRNGYALYFSRAPIPFARDAFAGGIHAMPAGLPAYRHIGIYAYRAAFLARYAQMEPAEIEKAVALEQLRALWHGHKISVAVTADAPHAGVDTAEDLEHVRALLARS